MLVTTVFLRGDSSQDTSAFGDRVYFFSGESRSLDGLKLDLLIRLIRLCRREAFDLVIGHRYKPVYLLGFVSFFVRIPLLFGVVHEHGMLRRRHRRLHLRCWCSQIRLIAVSESVRSDLIGRCPRLAYRVLCLPNAIDMADVGRQFTRQEARSYLGLPQDEIILGSVGRLVKSKRCSLLLEAFAQCLPQLPDLPMRLVLIGDGREREALELRIRELGLSRRVTLVGWVDEADRFMPAFDAFVLPSGAEEAFGRVLLEAMAASLPIISSDVAGPVEVAGEFAWLFRADDVESLASSLTLVLGKLAEGDHQEIDKRVSLASWKLAGCYALNVVRQEFRSWQLVRALLPWEED